MKNQYVSLERTIGLEVQCCTKYPLSLSKVLLVKRLDYSLYCTRTSTVPVPVTCVRVEHSYKERSSWSALTDHQRTVLVHKYSYEYASTEHDVLYERMSTRLQNPKSYQECTSVSCLRARECVCIAIAHLVSHTPLFPGLVVQYEYDSLTLAFLSAHLVRATAVPFVVVYLLVHCPVPSICPEAQSCSTVRVMYSYARTRKGFPTRARRSRAFVLVLSCTLPYVLYCTVANTRPVLYFSRVTVIVGTRMQYVRVLYCTVLYCTVLYE